MVGIKCNHELKLYFGIILGATLLIASDLFNGTSSLGISLRDAFFKLGSHYHDRGYTTVNYDRWSTFSKIILFINVYRRMCRINLRWHKVIRMVMLKLVKEKYGKFSPKHNVG